MSTIYGRNSPGVEKSRGGKVYLHASCIFGVGQLMCLELCKTGGKEGCALEESVSRSCLVGL